MDTFPEKDATVILSGIVMPGAEQFKLDEEKSAREKNAGRGGVAIYITDIPKEWHFDAPTEPVVLHFRDGEIVPFTCCVQTLQPLHVVAKDGRDHRLHVGSKIQHKYAKLSPKDFRCFIEVFGAPEEGVLLACGHHAEEAYVTVVDHPFFTITKDDGTFRLPRPLPPGTYTVRAYYPGWGHVEKKVQLKGDVKESSIELHLVYQGDEP